MIRRLGRRMLRFGALVPEALGQLLDQAMYHL
jgi:hypothetical protein